VLLTTLLVVSYLAYLIFKVKQLKLLNVILNQYHNKFETLFEQSTDAMILVHKGKYVAVNHAAVKLFGYPDKDSLLTTKAGSIAPIYQLDGQRSVNKWETICRKLKVMALLVLNGNLNDLRTPQQAFS
jgi:PAS domain-containing protein